MKTRAELEAAIAALESYLSAAPVPMEYLLNKYRAQLAALAETPPPDTIDCPKCGGWAETTTGHDCDRCGATGEVAPPDPRDEALEMAEKALKMFDAAAWDRNFGEGLSKLYCQSVSREISNALAAIARAKGGR